MEKIKPLPEFWETPPWGDGREKYRLGLKPIHIDEWFQGPPNKNLIDYKRGLLENKYNTVVRAIEGSEKGQKLVAEHLNVKQPKYQDPIADASLMVQDDLCLIETRGEQRLIAACVCSPSYWDLTKKIGKSLKEVHQPVKTLNEKIGGPIQKFIESAPVMKPFVRQNWFVHQDTKRMHLMEEKISLNNPSNWFFRSERETVCRLDELHSLFSINVRFQPLSYIHEYQGAKNGLLRSLDRLDDSEIDYFGGKEKVDILVNFLKYKELKNDL